jgi:heat shock protein HslJ
VIYNSLAEPNTPQHSDRKRKSLLSVRNLLLSGAIALANCSMAEVPPVSVEPGQTVPPVEDQGKLLASLVATQWQLEDLCGSPVVEGSHATLEFAAVDKVAGRGSVNHFSGGIGIEKDRLRIGPLMVTEMAGPPALMTQEQAFLEALGKASSLSLKGEVLSITVEGKDKPLRFTRIAKE